VWELIKLANRHPRVNILQPGPGVGGHCIAVDPWFIVSQADGQAKLIKTAREVNDSKPSWVIEKVDAAVADHLSSHPGKSEKDIVIACFGLAFKPDIDDLRESPSLEIAKNISNRHVGKVIVVEPNIASLPAALPNVELCSIEEAFERADVLLLLVDHKPFKSVPSSLLQGRQIVDTRGIWLV
jgi:UDP-N-acetyl-D-mannosaminuronic acid dehydrogenase